MTRIIVLRWPERSGALVRKKFRSVVIESAAAKIDDALPPEWLIEADEIRIVTGSSVFYRTISLEGGRTDELLEAAKYAAEPTLPRPLTEMAVASFEAARKGRMRDIMVTAMPLSELDAIQAWAAAVSAGVEEPPPVTWIGTPIALQQPTANASVRGTGWAAISVDGRWRAAQSAPTGNGAGHSGEEAAQALQKAYPDKIFQWTDIKPDEAWSAAVSAHGASSWVAGRAVPAAKVMKHWPTAVAIAACVLFSVTFGIRFTAAQRRIKTADDQIQQSFSTTLPGVKPVSPREQLRARLSETRASYEAMSNRIAKKGSALETLYALEKAMGPDNPASPAVSAIVNDLRIGSDQFSATGSAVDVQVVQSIVQAMKDAGNGAGQSGSDTEVGAFKIAEPDIRRSPAGLGFDFTIRGAR